MKSNTNLAIFSDTAMISEKIAIMPYNLMKMISVSVS